MSVIHVVQVGLLGTVGKYRATGPRVYPRDCEVICRTSRGLEVGRVICEVVNGTIGAGDPSIDEPLDGDLLRRLSAEDRAVIERLDGRRDRAFEACRELIGQRNIDATLVDAEHLFDGQSVWFYFLGAVSPEIESLSGELAEVYERHVNIRGLTEALNNGCGPDCGTGSSCGSCSGCSLRVNCVATK